MFPDSLKAAIVQGSRPTLLVFYLFTSLSLKWASTCLETDLCLPLPMQSVLFNDEDTCTEICCCMISSLCQHHRVVYKSLDSIPATHPGYMVCHRRIYVLSLTKTSLHSA